MQVKSIAECSKGSILQYFQPSLSYHFRLRPLFCLYLSGRLRQVLLYTPVLEEIFTIPAWYRLSCDPWSWVQIHTQTNTAGSNGPTSLCGEQQVAHLFTHFFMFNSTEHEIYHANNMGESSKFQKS